METYHDNWNACLLFRNKQLTKQLKEYQNASVLAECSSSLLVSLACSVLKAKQRIKGKLTLSAADCLDKYIQIG